MSSTHRQTAPGQPIPAPEDFPVSWENPDDTKLTWGLDNHATEPMPPLSGSVATAILQGFNTAFGQLGVPIHLRYLFINGYPYATVVPSAAPPEAVMKTIGAVNRVAPGLIKLLMGRMTAGMAKQQLDRLNPILGRLDTYWQDELLPEIKQHLAYFKSCDLRGLSQEQLRAHFGASLKRAERVTELHASATFPSMIAVGLFDELYCEVFEGATSLDAMRLLQGFDNQTLVGDRALWQLSRAALTMPGVRQTLADCAATDIVPALEGSGEGRRFLADLRAYLNQYGQRSIEIAEPSWIEDPTPVIEILKAYMTRPDTRPEAEQAWLVAEREKAVAEARSRLAGYPQPVVARFETLLKAAQSGTGIKEDSHWSILPLFYQIRRLALEFGRRLAEAGTLETVDDVFYLTSDELLDGDSGVIPPVPERVKERRAELERFRHMTPPPMLGTMPHFVPDDSGPFSQLRKKGDLAIWSGNGSDAQGLQGTPGSAGMVRGIARVVHSLAEAGKLQPGDVLVTKMTMPPWTPLFATAVAVVTDTGGVLSHAAIVAREYHIPAVVGTGRATKTFHDGQLLEVDGTAGVVRVLDN
ncbi:MAG TPA: PEP-utilizing enzyme [Candidatus Binatia bacterium]|jgi:pyruvate,water dikinase|nr:PEP-utilizing enzyme [Candidatus Binatia bacterium]